MARTYTIGAIVQSGGPGVPGQVTLDALEGDVSNSFAGKLWWNPSTYVSAPEYSPAPPGFTDSIRATTFEIINNPSYNGRYTVYSPVSAGDAGTNPSSVFTAGSTTIRVNEIIGPPLNVGDDLIGSVTNISTYLISVSGGPTIVVPPDVQLDDRPLSVVGRHSTPWGEPFTQNFIHSVQHFASNTSPTNPYLGMIWYNTGALPSPTVEIWTGSSWVVLSVVAPGANTTYRHTEPVASTTWVITHNLGVPAPEFVCFHDFFVDVGAGVHKPILPQDVTYNSANQLTVTFSAPYAGVALLRP